MIRLILLITIVSLIMSCQRRQTHNSQPIVFLHYWSDDLSAGIDTMMQIFTSKNKGCSVKVTGFDHESYKTSIKVMLAGGNAPDLFSYWAGARTKYLKDGGYLFPLNNVWEKEKLDTVFTPLVLHACKIDGTPYLLPVTQHYVAIFYNKKVFERFGVTPPHTWDEFLKLCDTFVLKGVTPIALGSRDLWPAQFWFDYLLLRSSGLSFRDSLMDGTVPYTDKQVVDVFAMWNEMLQKGYFNETAHTLDWSGAARLVARGEIPMTLAGTWIVGLFNTQLHLREGVDYDYFSFPLIDSAISPVALGPIDGVLLSKDGDSERAQSIISYFSQPDVQRAMSVGSGALSPSIDVAPSDKSPIQKRIHAELQSVNSWAFNYDLATSPEIAEKGLAMFGEFLENPSSYRQLLDSLQVQIDELPSRNK